jgi:hypothetical protein
MIKPLDLLVRVGAIPHVAWSMSGSVLGVRRRISEAIKRDADSWLVKRMLDGLFDRVEGQCRVRWVDGFGFVCEPDGDASQAA